MDDDARGVGVQKGRMGDEGFAVYRRWKGREFTKPVAEFGEHVARDPPWPGPQNLKPHIFRGPALTKHVGCVSQNRTKTIVRGPA